jgi:hypothetical protein
VETGGRPRGLQRGVDAAAGRPLDRLAGAAGLERLVGAEGQGQLAPGRDRVDRAHAPGACQARHLDEQEPDGPEPYHGDVVAETDARVVGRDQRDRANADEQPALERRAGGKLHGRVGGAGRGVEVEHRLVAMRGADVDEVAGLHLVDVRAGLGDRAHQLVAERGRIGLAGRVGRDERAQRAVEDAVGEGGGAPVEVELGAVADAAEQRPHPDLPGREARGVLIPQPQCAWTFELQCPSHSALLLLMRETERRA